ncbi:dipicolinate synthase subunit DpsA [Natroniella sulfidigena]|uniref:dipicolinate synthase subunit DpsA n=1 Tax=Natroniella sulfidigena TaxID=723921 RepID=UPI00200A00CF|nr:dipicolinate synthase subunit DpsA [Natroniella sulfidigena]MCK8816463.1 dipicolinate synthase subunit DpsA [Natroniella sulfidigena]
MYDLTGLEVAVLGGDARELELISNLLNQGAALEVVGRPSQLNEQNIDIVNSLEELETTDLKAVIAPMTGTDTEYKIKKTFNNLDIYLTEDFFASLEPNTIFFIGFAKPKIKEWCQKYQLQLVELADLDEVAILNAIPTAEGAIEIAIREMPITLHNNNSFVLGLGRVGLTLARMLHDLGSKTYGVARKPKDLARAVELGLTPVDFVDLADQIAEADFIFNTVPVMVLDREILEQVNPEAIIIDLASAPGGTDFEAAQELGIKAELALGLPGKVAPTSAGKILSEIIPRIILKEQ